MQEYSFEVTYRSGKKNVVADALSRLEMEPDSLAICSLQMQNGLDSDEILTTIQEEQGKDKFGVDLLNYLQKLELTEDRKTNIQIIAWSRFVMVENGMLYHLWSCSYL